MKTILTVLLLTMLNLHVAFGQENIPKMEKSLGDLTDSTWTITTHLYDNASNRFKNGVLLGTVKLSKNKTDFIEFQVCKPLNENLLIQEIKNDQVLASCLLSEDYYLFRSILKIENYYLFLPVYPCWSSYGTNSQLMMKKLAEKTKIKEGR